VYHAIACLRSYQNYLISHKLWPKFGNCWISRIGSSRFWWNSVQHEALMRTMCSREMFTKKCPQQQIFDTDLKGAWYNNYVTFTPIAQNFMLYCRLIYMLFILCVRLTIKVKVRIPESFKVRWYPPKKTGSSHLNWKRWSYVFILLPKSFLVNSFDFNERTTIQTLTHWCIEHFWCRLRSVTNKPL